MHIARALVIGALAAASLFSCGEDEGTSPNLNIGDGGESETPIAGAGQSTGGTSTGGGGVANLGGTSAGTVNAGMGGEGGTLIAMGGAGTGPGTGGSGAEGGTMSTLPGEQLTLCTRLTGLVKHADDAGRAFAKAQFFDCRVKWTLPIPQDQQVPYRDRLVTFNLEFWGCQGDPVTDFALTYDAPDLSRGDVDILVEHYLDVVTEELDLSAPERSEMQAALYRLAAPQIASDSSEPSQSSCPVEMGGGGAGGGAP